MKGKRTSYSDAELAWIKANATRPRILAHADFVALFEHNDLTLPSFNSLCKRKGWLTGRNGRFEKGTRPHNTGKKMPFNAASAATQFKKGQHPHNTKYVGHERIEKKNGYIEICIDEVNPHTGFRHRYVLKHKWLWETLNGPVPKGMCLKSIDGNRQNTDPANWQLIPRALLPRLAGKRGRDYDKAPAELKPTILAVAKVEHAVMNRKRKA